MSGDSIRRPQSGADIDHRYIPSYFFQHYAPSSYAVFKKKKLLDCEFMLRDERREELIREFLEFFG
jgi:hypothetical protein